jgi:two-component system sensor histidine kinase QseC
MTRPASLQGRLVALVLGMVLLVWAAAAALTWVDARHELDELLDSHLAQAAALLVVQQADLDDDGLLDAPTLHRYAPKVAFLVFHEGALVLRSANAPAWPVVGAGTGFERGFRTMSVAGADWRVFAAQGAERDVQVYVGERMDSRSSILRAVLRSAAWPILLALPVLGLAVWWAVARGVAPLRRLGRTLAGRAADDLQPVALAGAPAEMVPMVGALNGLFARIAALLDSERRFTADAAHELRTPIAAIRAQAQVALAEADDERRRHALRKTLAGCDRATRLVEQLLTLSRLEADAAPGVARVDLAAVVRSAVAEVAPAALARGQAIEVEAGAASVVIGDEVLLHVLARNLVDNAARYSPPQARIAVHLAREDDRIVLAVEDSGPGLPEADLARLGQRFFRVGGNEASGSGLGWSIVRRIADLHGAQVAVRRSSALGGLAVRISLPAAL